MGAGARGQSCLHQAGVQEGRGAEKTGVGLEGRVWDTHALRGHSWGL